jgi:rhodanese-related sulfurtransferase
LYDVPEISPKELAAKLAAGENLLVLDVREHWEIDHVSLPCKFERCPTSLLAEQGPDGIPPSVREGGREIIVVCHHGVRSADVTLWLIEQGCSNVKSLAGGVDAYAREVDPSIGAY